MSEKQDEKKSLLKEVVDQLIAGLSSEARQQVASFSVTMNINPSGGVKITGSSAECMEVCKSYHCPNQLDGVAMKSTCSNVCLKVISPFECRSVCKPFSFYEPCFVYGCPNINDPCKINESHRLLDTENAENREIQEKIKSGIRAKE